MYTGGVKEPFFVSSPLHPASHGTINTNPVSLLDIVPTVLAWLEVPYPDYNIFRKQGRVKLGGRSVLEYLGKETHVDRVT